MCLDADCSNLFMICVVSAWFSELITTAVSRRLANAAVSIEANCRNVNDLLWKKLISWLPTLRPLCPSAQETLYRLLWSLQAIDARRSVYTSKSQSVFFSSPTRSSSFSTILLFRSSRPAWLFPGDAIAGHRRSGTGLVTSTSSSFSTTTPCSLFLFLFFSVCK